MNGDLISRSALLEQVRFSMPIDSERRRVIADCVETFRRLITEAPAVDAVAVVRCKDCKWLCPGKYHYSCARHTGLALIKQEGSVFCSYGERRADNAD